MKTDVYTLTNNDNDFAVIPSVTEKAARYNGLEEKEIMRLRLLSEELICMLPQLLNYGSGRFWIESERREYELHVSLTPDEFVSIDREKLLSVSTDGKNAAAVGIISKICIAVEKMMSSRAKAVEDIPYDFYDMGLSEYGDYKAWSLMNYRNCVKTGYERYRENNSAINEKWDELERSILVNLADDVTVGVISNRVDITVRKRF